ncbi:hypothetical protein N1851_013879 [Merluccius polli]|uniref:LEM domain-containing protein n=1 Tax=Merluccius polli TaxID=89951 RepID=A0AA47MVE7_MERPO|nr:hypothetical protein N1851_013879 [Merluccius polli]
MSRLSGKSDQEIRDLLDEYGINHGPVVDSTRALYEKKILEAMGRKEAKPSPDKTYYREEKEEVTYVSYRQPIRSEDRPYDTPSTYRTMSYSNATPVKSSVPVPEEKSRLIPLWVQFLVFLVVAVFLYFVFCNMESTHSEPFKGID